MNFAGDCHTPNTYFNELFAQIWQSRMIERRVFEALQTNPDLDQSLVNRLRYAVRRGWVSLV
jgi:hypothetical protein